jgi:hypothetical protein
MHKRPLFLLTLVHYTQRDLLRGHKECHVTVHLVDFDIHTVVFEYT